MFVVNKLPLRLSGTQVTAVGLTFSKKITFKQWDEIGAVLARLEDGVTWWVGDWIAYGEKTFSNRIETAHALTGFSYKTLYNANYVSSNVPFSLRREKLSWSHHANVAHLEFVEKQRWLALAERHSMSVRCLRASINAGRVITESECQALGQKTGGVISLTGLSVKLRLWQNHAPKIEEMDLVELEDAHRNLLPFVETDRRIEARLREVRRAEPGQG